MNVVQKTLDKLNKNEIDITDESMLMVKCQQQNTDFLINYWCTKDPTFFEDCNVDSITQKSNSSVVLNCKCGHSMTYNTLTADYVCENCGLCSYNSDMGYSFGKKPIEEMDIGRQKRINKYKRMTNLKTILRNLQAYCSPLNEKVYKFVQKHTPFNGTLLHLKSTMKTEGISKYNQKIHLIYGLVNPDYVPLKLSREEYKRIFHAFYEIVRIFENLDKKSRSNFISYHLALYFICTDLKYMHVLSHLLLPKGDKTFNKQINAWREILD